MPRRPRTGSATVWTQPRGLRPVRGVRRRAHRGRRYARHRAGGAADLAALAAADRPVGRGGRPRGGGTGGRGRGRRWSVPGPGGHRGRHRPGTFRAVVPGGQFPERPPGPAGLPGGVFRGRRAPPRAFRSVPLPVPPVPPAVSPVSSLLLPPPPPAETSGEEAYRARLWRGRCCCRTWGLDGGRQPESHSAVRRWPRGVAVSQARAVWKARSAAGAAGVPVVDEDGRQQRVGVERDGDAADVPKVAGGEERRSTPMEACSAACRAPPRISGLIRAASSWSSVTVHHTAWVRRGAGRQVELGLAQHLAGDQSAAEEGDDSGW